MPKVYIAYHIDHSGVAQAKYHLVASEDGSAVQEARKYLANHESIEVWNGSRRVAHLTRD
jgi:hypothetical protein